MENNDENKYPYRDEAVKKAERKLQQRIKELSAIYKTSKSITSSKDVKEIIELILDNTLNIISNDGSLMYLYKSSDNNFVLSHCKGVKDNPELSNKVISGTGNLFCQKKVLQDKQTYIINHISKLDQESQQTLNDYNIKSFISMPLLRNGEIIGLFVNFSKKPGYFNKNDIRVLEMFSKQAAIAIQNAKLLRNTQSSYLDTVKTLANIIEVKDSSTYGHSERVMARALEIAEEMDLTERQKSLLKYASFLHDIGKIDIDVSILRKPSNLTEEEWKVIKTHPKTGANIVEEIEFLKDLAPVIYYHHARYEGGGYPDQEIKREDIPLCARVLAVADAYESMINDRPYRKALSKKEAIEELELNAGTQFDPHIVKILIKNLKK